MFNMAQQDQNYLAWSGVATQENDICVEIHDHCYQQDFYA